MSAQEHADAVDSAARRLSLQRSQPQRVVETKVVHEHHYDALPSPAGDAARATAHRLLADDGTASVDSPPVLAVTDAANRERSSGQAGLFGGEDNVEPDLRLVEAQPWPRSEQMNVEKDVFGFYFAAHPVQEFREVASANGARSYAALMEGGVDGGRAPAVMAAMVESVNKGRTKRGAEFIRADFSDSSGQFSAACFEESLVDSFVQWAQDGTCVLLNVELDSPNPDDPPRVTVRGAPPSPCR